MLAIKRIITAGICFVVFFLFFWFGILIVGGALIGAVVGTKSTDPEQAKVVAVEKANEFTETYAGEIVLASTGLAALSSGYLAFGGIFPWCRRKEEDSIEA